MNGPSLLIANLGAEETDAWRKLLREPAPRTMARLWTLLFPADCRVDPPGLREDWPADVGPVASDGAFAWTDALRGAVAWYPSHAAEAEARKAGEVLAGPAPDLVARVHDKAWSQRIATEEGLVPRPLRGLVSVFEPEELVDADATLARIRSSLASWPAWSRGRFALKPRLATSGRGRVPGDAAAFDETTVRGALPRLAERRGALLEPWLDRTCDLSVQLHLDASGQLTLLGTLEQILSPSGLYQGHRGLVDWRGRVSSGSRHEQALLEAGSVLARRAAAEGFHGPCGLDAFVFKLTEDGETRELLRPVTEFNARFTTGTVVIGLIRRVLSRLGLEPGDQRAFEFRVDASSTPPTAGQRVFALDPTGAELRVDC